MSRPKLRPPWNDDLVGAGYWVSLGISLLLIIGAALTLARLLCQIRAEWFLVLGIVGLFGLVLVWFSLGHPHYSACKAFYAFSALLPFSALVAVGWDWLRQRHRVVGVAVWMLLLVWSMTVYASFWVRSGNPETQLLRGIELGSALMQQGKLDEAISQLPGSHPPETGLRRGPLQPRLSPSPGKAKWTRRSANSRRPSA